MKSRKTLSSRLINRYLLIIRNEEDFAEKTSFTFTYAKLIVLIVFVCIFMLGISLVLVNTALEKWLDPRYAQAETQRQLIALKLAVDSLEWEVEKKDDFITNFQRIVRGDSIPDQADVYAAESQKQKIPKEKVGEENLAEIDAQFRKEFEEQGLMLLASSNTTTSELEEIFFFSPLSGIVSAPYDPKIGHHGIDIVSKKNEPVKCVADGTVFMSSWTQDAGYVIAVQHRSDIISVYKHNSTLLKKAGDFVNAGDVLAIIGNTGELTTGPHLHFELWYNGNPANPEEFVSF